MVGALIGSNSRPVQEQGKWKATPTAGASVAVVPSDNFRVDTKEPRQPERADVDPDQTLRPKNADTTGVSFIDTARFVTNKRAVGFKTARIT